MSSTVATVTDVVERLWPREGAESWDAPGLVCGSPSASVHKIVLVVDAVAASIEDALDQGADLVLSHHPLLLRGVTSVAADRYKGALLTQLIKSDCALLAAHTNADVVEEGTSAVLAERIGLVDVAPIRPSVAPGTGIGRVGALPRSATLGWLATALAEMLPATAGGVKVSGEFDAPIRRIAVCGGAGDSLLSEAAVLGADVYITSDLRHHPASESREQSTLAGGPFLIDVSHWASEWMWLETAARQLRDALPGVEVHVSDIRTDPWDFVVTQ